MYRVPVPVWITGTSYSGAMIEYRTTAYDSPLLTKVSVLNTHSNSYFELPTGTHQYKFVLLINQILIKSLEAKNI